MTDNTAETTPVDNTAEAGVPNETPGEAESVAAEPDAPEVADDGKPDPATRDVAKYRKRAQAAEKERDTLAERLTHMQRAEAERLAGNNLGDGADLWSAGTELDSLLDDDGNLSADLVDQAVQQVIDKHPHWRKPAKPSPPASLVTSDGKITGDQKPSFVDAFAPRR